MHKKILWTALITVVVLFAVTRVPQVKTAVLGA
jgi:hypothetical protein